MVELISLGIAAVTCGALIFLIHLVARSQRWTASRANLEVSLYKLAYSTQKRIGELATANGELVDGWRAGGRMESAVHELQQQNLAEIVSVVGTAQQQMEVLRTRFAASVGHETFDVMVEAVRRQYPVLRLVTDR